MKKTLLALALLMAGCAPTSSVVDSAYVKADADTEAAVEPILRGAATTQPALAPDVNTTLDAWKGRISAAQNRLSAVGQ